MATFPAAIVETFQVTDFTSIPDVGRLLSIVAICLVVVASIVYIQDGVRKIPIQHARRNAGGKSQGGLKSFIPLRVNMAGVIPIIFASSIMMFPPMILPVFSGKISRRMSFSNRHHLVWAYPLFSFGCITLC